MVNAAGAMAGYQIINGFLQADMVRMQANTQAKIDEFNASIQELNAWKTEAYGATLIARTQVQDDQIRGSMKVFAASQGAKIEGSLAEVNAQNELNSFLNKIDIDNRTTEQAMGYNQQARQIRLGSSLNKITSNVRANSLILGGLAQGAGTYAAYQVKNQKITQDDVKTPSKDLDFEDSPSGYSLTNYKKSRSGVESWDISLMPGG